MQSKFYWLLLGVACAVGCSKDPSGPAAAASAATPAAAPERVTVKANFEQFNGVYEAQGVVALTTADGSIEVVMQRGCQKPLGCDAWNVDQKKAACPSGFTASITLKKPALGKRKATLDLYGVKEAETGMVSDVPVTLTRVSDKEIAGTLDSPETETGGKGAFSAKICPPD